MLKAYTKAYVKNFGAMQNEIMCLDYMQQNIICSQDKLKLSC